MMRKMFIMMFMIALTGPSVYADDVAIDSNGNVTTGVSNPNANLEVTGASGEDAIMGSASGTGAAGVYGINTDNGNYGILGYAHGAGDFGVYGYSLDYGVYGTSPGGYAGYFQGNAVVTGTLTVGTLLGYTENDPQVGSLISGNWCVSNGSQVNCNQSAPVTSETDPQVGSLINGNWCVSSGGQVTCNQSAPVTSETDPQVGGNTTNYVPKWNGSSLVTGSMYDSGGNIGIGTSTPSYKLEVRGNSIAGYIGYFENNNYVSGNAYGIYAHGDAYGTGSGEGHGATFVALGGSASGAAYGTQHYAYANGSSNAYGVYSDATLGVTTGQTYAFYGEGDGYFSGNVGIGTDTPSQKLDINGNVRIGNRFRNGLETGTSQGPGYPDQGGMIVRRISSTFAYNGEVVAATDTISFQRDGTYAGFKAVVTGGSHNTIMCMGVDGSGTNVNSITTGVSTGTHTVYTNAQNVVYMSCSFGMPYSAEHTTQLTLYRESGDSYWNGFIMSTYDQ